MLQPLLPIANSEFQINNKNNDQNHKRLPNLALFLRYIFIICILTVILAVTPLTLVGLKYNMLAIQFFN